MWLRLETEGMGDQGLSQAPLYLSLSWAADIYSCLKVWVTEAWGPALPALSHRFGLWVWGLGGGGGGVALTCSLVDRWLQAPEGIAQDKCAVQRLQPLRR